MAPKRDKAEIPKAPEKKEFILPSVEEFCLNIEQARKLNEFNKVLNIPPPDDWLEPHPTATKRVDDGKGGYTEVPCVYLTIQRMEWLLTSLYLGFEREVRTVQAFPRHVVVTVRIWVTNPVTGLRQFNDGVATALICSGENPHPANIENGLILAPPCAETMAFKDACEQFGKIFGKDLNRRDRVYYENLEAGFEQKKWDEHYKGKAGKAIDATIASIAAKQPAKK